MEFYGIRGIVLKWFKSYITNRNHYVSYQNCKSEPMQIHCGVPQGSVLGPLLFLIYVNDLPECLKSADAIMFADDTTIYKSSKNIRDIYDNMNLELNVLSDWFRANKLSLNANKCNYMLFTNNDIPRNAGYQLKICGNKIERKSCVKCLGIHIDEKLT